MRTAALSVPNHWRSVAVPRSGWPPLHWAKHQGVLLRASLRIICKNSCINLNARAQPTSQSAPITSFPTGTILQYYEVALTPGILLLDGRDRPLERLIRAGRSSFLWRACLARPPPGGPSIAVMARSPALPNVFPLALDLWWDRVYRLTCFFPSIKA